MKLLVHTSRVLLTLVFFLMGLAGVLALNSGKIDGPYTFSLAWTLTAIGALGSFGMLIASQTQSPIVWYVGTATGAIVLFPLLLAGNFQLGKSLASHMHERAADRHFPAFSSSAPDLADLRQQTSALRGPQVRFEDFKPDRPSAPPPPPPDAQPGTVPTAVNPPPPGPRVPPQYTPPLDQPDIAKRPAPTKSKEPVYIPPAGLPGTPTELVGGPEGWQFEAYDQNRRAVVGFRYRMGSWAGTPAVARFDPLYDRRQPATSDNMAVAREGYVVGGLHVVAGDLVNAVRIIFVRQQSGSSLNKSDFYLSDWIGDPGENKPKVLGDGQTPVIGICGRNGAVKNAIALIMDKP